MADKDSIRNKFDSILWPESESMKLVRDIVAVILFFAVLAGIAYAFTGMPAPFFSVSSGSMEPNLERGDLVVSVSPEKTDSPNQFRDTHITTAEQAGEYTSINQKGHVILYDPSNYDQIFIHRAMFWVEEGENWYDKADSEYITAENCDELLNCPAPNSGFITKGDANNRYDQAAEISAPVPPEDIHSVAWFHVPYLGYIRLVLGMSLFVSIYRR